MSEYIWSQICVVLSVIFLALTYFIKDKKIVLILICLEALTYGLQYVFLHQYTGAILNMSGIIRGIWFYIDEQRGKTQNNYSLAINLLIIYGLAVLTYETWIDAIALVGTCYFTFLVWQKNTYVYRWGSILSSAIWTFYNVLVHSVLGIVLEVALLVAEFVGAMLLINKKYTKTDKKE